MANLNAVDFSIRGRENIAKAAKAIRARKFRFITDSFNAEDDLFISNVLDCFGFECDLGGDFISVCGQSAARVDADSDFERILKTIRRYVEPGSYIELSGREGIFRYVSLFDTVERWSKPHTLFAKKEAI